MLFHVNYYRDQSDIPLEVRKKTNYDHPDAMETELLVQQLMELKEASHLNTEELPVKVEGEEEVLEFALPA